jgi:transposase
MDVLCNPLHWKVEEAKQTARAIIVKAISLDGPTSCPKCGASADHLKPNGSKIRKLFDRPIHGKRVTILMYVRRYVCLSCDKTSLQPVKGVRKGNNITDRLRKYVEEETLLGTFKAAARVAKISERAARDIFNSRAERLKKMKMPKLPRVVGLDGVYFARKERLMMTNLTKGRVLNVLPTVKEDKLIKELMKLSESERKSVRVVVLDMSQSLARVARAAFPNVTIVNDRYHVHEKANKACDRVRIELRKTRDGDRRAGAPTMVRRELLRKRQDALKSHEAAKLKWWGDLIPELGEVYVMKELFCAIWYSSSPEAAERKYKEWLDKLKGCSELVQKAFEKELTKTVDNWHVEVFAYFEHPYTNGFTERMNQEVKRLQHEGKRLSFESMRVKVIFGTALRWKREKEEAQHRKCRKKRKPTKRSKNGIATRSNISVRAKPARQPHLFSLRPKSARPGQKLVQKSIPHPPVAKTDSTPPREVQGVLPLVFIELPKGE